MALRVKCKGCGAAITTTAGDPPRPSPGGGQAFAAACGACAAVTHYRRPDTSAPGDSPLANLDAGARTPSGVSWDSREMRLPAIVLKAAWWVRFTLIVHWAIIALYLTFIVGTHVLVTVFPDTIHRLMGFR